MQGITSGSTTIYTSTANESSYTITSSNMASAAANGHMIVELYKAGGTTTLLDKQTIVITADGAKGQQGQQGEPVPGRARFRGRTQDG